ncbi:DUF2169 family type VI secretion system accessory protein [Sorangium sp. So ce131]|uniref:DUF2169 family type VI secretion system accessory protein n=1 Tax=Sorangium sp. So ce131 TaxID=3133282 RepID=UPI003F621A67
MNEPKGTLPVDPAQAAQLAARALPFSPGNAGGVACVSLTPAASATAALATVDTVPWRHEGKLRLTVVVKASFSIDTSPMRPAEAAAPFHAKDVHDRRGPMAHVTAASDRVPYRQYVDVTALGHAAAPGGRPVAEMNARLALVQRGVPGLDKTVRVVGRRKGPGAAPEPFARMPIVYERAAGGVGVAENPVGCGERDGELPNVLDPSDPQKPAGFGPLAATWPARSRRLPAGARAGLDADVMEVPGAFDWSYFQCAPRDQWVSALQPGAIVVLEGFHADRPRVQSALPDARVAGAVYGLDDADPDAPTRLVFHADGLHVDADRLLCTITWRAHVELRDPAQRERLMAVAGVGVGSAPAVPARRAAGPVERQRPAAAPPSRVEAPREPRRQEGAAGGTLALDGPGSAPASGTVALAPPSAGAAPGPSAGALLAALDFDGVPAQPGAAAGVAPVPAGVAPVPAGVAPVPAGVAPVPAGVAPVPAGVAPVPAGVAPVPAGVAPPALAPAPAAPPPALLKEPPAPSAARPEEPVTIERYAVVSSELAEPGALRSEVLSAHDLDEATWRKAERRFRDELGRALKRGDRALRERFDDAYVSAWERRHPDRFGAEQYARLVGAERRGTLALEIAELGLDAPLGMRLKRVWQRRAARLSSSA